MTNLNTKLSYTTTDEVKHVLSSYSSAIKEPIRISWHFEDLEQALIEHITSDDANLIVGCVAWVTNDKIMNALGSTGADGMKTTILVVNRDDENLPAHRRLRSKLLGDSKNGRYNRTYTGIPGLERLEPDTRIDYVRSIGIEDEQALMHSKFLVFCKRTRIESEKSSGISFETKTYHEIVKPYAVWTGSYNFSHTANNSIENALYIENEEIAQAHYKRFVELYLSSDSLFDQHPPLRVSEAFSEATKDTHDNKLLRDLSEEEKDQQFIQDVFDEPITLNEMIDVLSSSDVNIRPNHAFTSFFLNKAKLTEREKEGLEQHRLAILEWLRENHATTETETSKPQIQLKSKPPVATERIEIEGDEDDEDESEAPPSEQIRRDYEQAKAFIEAHRWGHDTSKLLANWSNHERRESIDAHEPLCEYVSRCLILRKLKGSSYESFIRYREKALNGEQMLYAPAAGGRPRIGKTHVYGIISYLSTNAQYKTVGLDSVTERTFKTFERWDEHDRHEKGLSTLAYFMYLNGFDYKL